MSTLSKTMAVLAVSLVTVGCAGAQRNTEVAEDGTPRTDAPHERHDERSEPRPDYWQKMR